MTSLRFVGGPKNGDVLHLTPGMPQPIEIRHKGWSGHYVLQMPDPKSISQFAPHFLWRGR